MLEAPRGAPTHGANLQKLCQRPSSSSQPWHGMWRGHHGPQGSSAHVPPAAPIPASHAGGVPKPPAPFPTRFQQGRVGFPAAAAACGLCLCTPQGVHTRVRAPARACAWGLSRCRHSAPGSDKASTGCDCQAELEGLEILGRIIRFHIVTAAAIRGSGRLISPPPPFCSLIFIRDAGRQSRARAERGEPRPRHRQPPHPDPSPVLGSGAHLPLPAL